MKLWTQNRGSSFAIYYVVLKEYFSVKKTVFIAWSDYITDNRSGFLM